MNKIMKLLALIVCAAMLLSASALAAGVELGIDNIRINLNDEMELDFSGIGLNLGFGEKDGSAGMHIGVDANDTSVLDIKAAVQGNKLLLAADGISKVYSMDLSSMMEQVPAAGVTVSDADQQAAAALGQKFMEILAVSMSEPSVMEMDGEQYTGISISISGDQMDELLASLAVLLDNHPELFVDSGYANFSAMLADMQADLSLEGIVMMGEAKFMAEFSLIGTDASGESEAISIRAQGLEETEENGNSAMAINASMGEGMGDDFIEALNLEVYLVDVGGDFGAAECTIYPADDESAGFYFGLVAPVVNGNDLWSAGFSFLDESVMLTFEGNTAAGTVNLCVEEDVMSFSYAMNNGAGAYELSVGVGEEIYAISAESTLAQSDAAWLDIDGSNTVDIMTISEDQVNMLGMEAMSVGMNALSALAQANETVAMLINNLMG